MVTYVGKEDITVFISGDYESLHCRVEGLLVSDNGVLFFDMHSKRERTKVEECVAVKTNAVIVPVGIERLSKKVYGINVSKRLFDPFQYINMSDSKEQLLEAMH